jgi:hypothetical protein
VGDGPRRLTPEEPVEEPSGEVDDAQVRGEEDQEGEEVADGPVEEQAAGDIVAAGADLNPERLGVGFLEEGPDDRRRPAGRHAGEAGQLLGWKEVLRQEPAKPVLVDLADERPHGAVIARAAVGIQHDRIGRPLAGGHAGRTRDRK